MITIIVLLILAAVSISTLTGENGILTKASTAKEETERSKIEEQIKVAILGSYDQNGTLDIGILENELRRIEGASVQDNNGNFPVTVTVGKYTFTIEQTGKIQQTTSGESTNKSQLEEAKENGQKFEVEKKILDRYQNQITVPEGFKIASDSASDVTGGVVIEDATGEATNGSQFVWIPVGEVKTPNGNKKIELNRYTFEVDGTPIPQGNNVIQDYYQELATSNYGNTTAKDIEGFKASAASHGGYYIGRYEARTTMERESKDDPIGQVTVKAEDYIYNYVTQTHAAEVSQNMYASDKTFTSDLINSYAWDTAIVYIQTYGQSNYAKQGSLNHQTDGFAKKGTNKLTDKTKQDKQCNIWDMASNLCEWTTESHMTSTATVNRSDYYSNGGDDRAGDRHIGFYNPYGEETFRIILYL